MRETRVFLLLYDKSPKQVSLEKEELLPFIILIMAGTHDASEELQLAADMELLCNFRGNPLEAILRLAASCYVFMYNYYHHL